MRRFGTARLFAILAAGMQLTGCPQFVTDTFEKVPTEGASSTDTASTSAGGTNGTTGIVMDGTGGTGIDTTSSTDAAGGSLSGAAGADSTGTESGGAGSTTDTTDTTGTTDTTSTTAETSASTGGTGGGSSVVPTTVVYAATDSSIYAARWVDSSFGAPLLWNSVTGSVAFMEAALAPDRSWGVVAYQGEGTPDCSLWLQRFDSDGSEPAIQISMGDAANCLTARGFDIAFEQQRGRALLVYAVAAGALEYQWIEPNAISAPETIGGAYPTSVVNWVRLKGDPTSDRMLVGYSAQGLFLDPLVVQEWDGTEFTPTFELSNDGVILDAQSFDFAYHQGNLLTLRGDVTDYGFAFRARDPSGVWSTESAHTETPNGNVQVIELLSLPMGVAGVLYDAEGSVASLGGVFWQDTDFVEERQLDATLPAISNFARATLKTDIARLGDVAVSVYSDEYHGASAAGTALGWAVKRPNTNWALQEDTLPIPFDQESRGAYPRSIRLARFENTKEGLVLVFGEDGGLFESHLSDLDVGWSEPVLIEAAVQSDENTPFCLVGAGP